MRISDWSSDVCSSDLDIFVLVDESHRSQTGRHGVYGSFALVMRRILPKACYLGFTGTPRLKKEKNTLATFGGLIHKYTIDEAVADDAVVPLLYEGRMVEQQITGTVIDTWFEKISAGLTDAQKADLKQKFSRMDALAKTSQAIRAKARSEEHTSELQSLMRISYAVFCLKKKKKKKQQ